MNKKLFAAAIVALSGVFALPAFAQNNKACPATCPENTCTTTDCNTAKCNPACSPFAGLNLTAEQQTKLDALKNKCKAERKDLKDKQKADKNKLKESRRQERQAKRAEMLASIKDILTPAQYVQFLENNFVNGEKAFKDGKFKNIQKKDGKGPKFGRDDRHMSQNNGKKAERQAL